MINPTCITRYDESESQLMEKLHFWILAAGKGGVAAASALERLYKRLPHARMPFDRVLLYCTVHGEIGLRRLMKDCGIGCSTLKARAFISLAKKRPNLFKDGPDELMEHPGIGPKTARGFILHSRRNVRYACLDRHILRWLRDQGHTHAPKDTPSSSLQYDRWEAIWLAACYAMGRTSAELDLEVWNSYASKVTNN